MVGNRVRVVLEMVAVGRAGTELLTFDEMTSATSYGWFFLQQAKLQYIP